MAFSQWQPPFRFAEEPSSVEAFKALAICTIPRQYLPLPQSSNRNSPPHCGPTPPSAFVDMARPSPLTLATGPWRCGGEAARVLLGGKESGLQSAGNQGPGRAPGVFQGRRYGPSALPARATKALVKKQDWSPAAQRGLFQLLLDFRMQGAPTPEDHFLPQKSTVSGPHDEPGDVVVAQSPSAA
eukprot:scaffold19_cov336-Pinguiococcus_pyrenoidosus.AAC.4